MAHGIPELLPTLILREPTAPLPVTPTGWTGSIPYHEMNAYLGAIALALAVVGGGAYRNRWVAFWVILAGLGGILMRGRFTCTLRLRTPDPDVIGSGRIPVRYHLWVSLAVAALTAVGVDHLSRPRTVRLRPALLTIAVLIVASIPILIYVYALVWSQPTRWRYPRTICRGSAGSANNGDSASSERLCSCSQRGPFPCWPPSFISSMSGTTHRDLPVLILADLLGSHDSDVPTITPEYWTKPPAGRTLLKADPGFVRLFWIAKRASNEPGYASGSVDFLSVRDTLDWSLRRRSGASPRPEAKRRCSRVACLNHRPRAPR